MGLMMRKGRNMQREQVWKGLGLVDVYEDVFSTTDRLQELELQLR